MTTNGPAGVGGTGNGGGGGTTQPALTKTLGQDAFMQLLITQLQHQDPTSPMADADFIAQLATFSQLEKMTAMATSLEHIEKALVPPSSGSENGDQ